jgi:hypothetical protein
MARATHQSITNPPSIPDLILAAIENHKAANAAYSAALDRASDEEIDALGDAETDAAWAIGECRAIHEGRGAGTARVHGRQTRLAL